MRITTTKGDEDMALIKCPECGREVSDKARSCPGCGHPFELFDFEKYANVSRGKTKTCKKCANKIPKKISICPYCGAKQNPVLEIIGIIVAAILIFGIILR